MDKYGFCESSLRMSWEEMDAYLQRQYKRILGREHLQLVLPLDYTQPKKEVVYFGSCCGRDDRVEV